MNYKLVFIDDNMREGLEHPFVRAIGKKRKSAELSVFIDPSKGLDYVLNNLNSKMIVFLDYKFDGYSLQGINVLKEIRKRTSLLYIVMMSANSINQIAGLDILEMINEDYIWFFDRNNGTIDDACNLIDKINRLWNVRFDCILENWIIKHPDDANKKVFSQPGQEESYTWERILVELREQTPIGKMFEKLINQFYIYNLTTKSEQNAEDNNSIQ